MSQSSNFRARLYQKLDERRVNTETNAEEDEDPEKVIQEGEEVDGEIPEDEEGDEERYETLSAY